MSEMYTDRLRDLDRIASLVNSETDIDAILQSIVDAVCLHSSWSMSSIMRIEQDKGFSYLVSEHNPHRARLKAQVDKWPLSGSPSVDVLERKEPLIIDDAQQADDYPGYAEDARQWGYRTVVILNLECVDLQGKPLVMSVQSGEKVPVDEFELTFLTATAHLASIALNKAIGLQTASNMAERLKHTIDVQADLMTGVLSSQDSNDLLERIMITVGRPLLIVDLTTVSVFASGPPDKDEGSPQLEQKPIKGREAMDIIAQLKGFGLKEDAVVRKLELPAVITSPMADSLILPLNLDGELVGCLIVLDYEGEADDLDAMVLQAVQFALSVQLMRSYVRFKAVAESRADLMSSLFAGNWRDRADTLLRGRNLGMNLDQPIRLLAIEAPEASDQSEPHHHRTLEMILSHLDKHAVVVRDGDKYVIVVPTQKDLESFGKRLLKEIKWLFPERATVAISRLCVQLEDYVAAERELTQALQLAEVFQRSGVISVSDFGGFGLLLSAAGRDNVETFVADTIGKIEEYDQQSKGKLLETIRAFIDTGCRYQACADRLGLHVTTLRYRLGRLQELFQVDLENADVRFDLDLALRLRAIGSSSD